MASFPADIQAGQDTQYICIAGTDTGIGKTFSTAALAISLQSRGYKVMVIKPVQTGISVDEISDIEMVTRLVPNTGISVCQLYDYPEALAPHQAAELADKSLPSLSDLITQITAYSEQYDFVIIEGAGGILVPLAEESVTLLEIAQALAAIIVLVIRVNLGTLNHTSLSIEAIRNRGLPLAGIMIGSLPYELDLAAQLNLQEFKSGKYGNFLGALPADSAEIAVDKFQKIAPEVIDTDMIIDSLS